MSIRTKALLALLLSTFFGATVGAAVKILLLTDTSFVIAFYRFGLAALIIIPWFLYNRPKHMGHVLRDVLPIAILSTANISLFFVALNKTTANAASIIYAATPILTAMLSPFLINERITKQKFMGIILGLIGVLFILVLPALNKTDVLVGDVSGNILVFIAACSWALYTIGSRYLIIQKHYEPITISAISISLTAFVTFILSLATSTIHIPRMVSHPQTLLLVSHLALFATIGMYLLYQYAIKHLSATTASLSNYIGPIFGFTINAIVLGERMTLGFIFGSFIVLIGVFLASGSQIHALAKRLQAAIKR